MRNSINNRAVFGTPLSAPLATGTTVTRDDMFTRRGRGLLVAFLAAVMMLSSPIAAQGAVQVHTTIPLAGGVIPGDTNPCTNEDLIHTDGSLHMLITYTENENRISGTALFQPQGAKLVGAVSGDQYVGTGMFLETFNEPVGADGAAVISFVSNFRIIGKGKTTDLLIHERGHITINGDGDVSAEINSSSVECR